MVKPREGENGLVGDRLTRFEATSPVHRLDELGTAPGGILATVLAVVLDDDVGVIGV